ncbi:MAG: DUF4286 family protein [Chitinophagaceae bacterium]
MVIYNVTLKVSWSIHENWFTWMKEKHIPEVMQTGMFIEHKMMRLLDIDEEEGPTYAVQYVAESRDKVDEYVSVFAPELRKDLINRFGDNVIAFRTLMEWV